MLAALLFAILATVAFSLKLRSTLSFLLAFDGGVLLFVCLSAWMFAHSDEHSMRRRAKAEDNGGWSFLLSSIAVSMVVLVALSAELHASKQGDLAGITIAAASLVLSWLFFNIMFVLHYAHRYYAAPDSDEKKLTLKDCPSHSLRMTTARKTLVDHDMSGRYYCNSKCMHFLAVWR